MWFVVRRLFILIAVLAGGHSAALAVDTPRENCARIADAVAQNELAEIPNILRQASKGALNVDAGAFRTLQPIVETGPVKVNDFLIEKDYNGTLLKTWRLLYFDWQSLYLRCTYVKVDGDWVLIHVGTETDEEKIDLP
ncbi:hypothetical protein [Dongia sp.]|uniref:hypothetical protein n=1 Tax=Dongia sp. TaxID=1977262 RepID=UPI0035B0241B